MVSSTKNLVCSRRFLAEERKAGELPSVFLMLFVFFPRGIIYRMYAWSEVRKLGGQKFSFQVGRRGSANIFPQRNGERLSPGSSFVPPESLIATGRFVMMGLGWSEPLSFLVTDCIIPAAFFPYDARTYEGVCGF